MKKKKDSLELEERGKELPVKFIRRESFRVVNIFSVHSNLSINVQMRFYLLTGFKT